ncbi:hypothetical protein GGI12_003765 [Dipsacomyces acuminosporus]|nr:hypothetical protein GGI12_003765 [Dipsacomyces acuminosporus]
MSSAKQSRPALPQNRYVQRTAAKEGVCFICGYLTPNIFVTEQSAPRDWFYICPKHTELPDFCAAAQDDTSKDRLIKQQQKDSADANSDTATKAKESSKGQPDSPESSMSAKGTSKPDTASSPPQTRRVYVLQKDYFYLRQRPFIRRWEEEQADLLAKRLPNVPRGRPL